MKPNANPYEAMGFDGDHETARYLLAEASRLNGAIHQGWKFRLLQGEILTRVKARVPGFFEQWLRAHWPEMGRTTVTRLMATWQHRDQLTPFMEDDNCSRKNNYSLSVQAVDTLALGGAQPDVIKEVRQRLEQGIKVTPDDIADLNRARKRKAKGQPAPRQPQPIESMALNLIRRGELERIREAVAIAERATVVTAEQVMAEQRLRDLGKLRFLPGADADFYRLKDGSWVRLPHAGRVDVQPDPPAESPATDSPEPAGELLTLEAAAARLGMKPRTLGQQLTPGQNPNGITRDGWLITKAGRGHVHITPALHP